MWGKKGRKRDGKKRKRDRQGAQEKKVFFFPLDLSLHSLSHRLSLFFSIPFSPLALHREGGKTKTHTGARKFVITKRKKKKRKTHSTGAPPFFSLSLPLRNSFFFRSFFFLLLSF